MTQTLQDRWIVFDAVGTLIDPCPSVGAAYQSVGARFGCLDPVESVARRFRTAFRASESRGSLATTERIEEQRWREIVCEVLPGVTDPEACFRELWDHFARPDSWKSFPDVDESLRTLRQAGYRLGIASNFDRRLNALCDHLPALQCLECRMISTEIGFRKPAAEFYAAVIARCGGVAGQIQMVGDDFEHDVQGPAAAGMRSWHLQRSGESGPQALAEWTRRLIGRFPSTP